MSRQPHAPPPHQVVDEEDDDAFLDLDDPANQIVSDEHEQPGNENEADGSSDGSDAGEAEEAAAEEAEVFEDLNKVPDRIPDREDAFACFTNTDAKPVHAVAAHPTVSGVYAVSGESETIAILDMGQMTAAGAVAAPASANTDEAAAPSTPAAVPAAHLLEGHTDTVSLLAFSPDGKWLASGSLDATVSLWSTATYERVHVLSDLSGEIMTLLWHPTSRLLVAGADDAQLGLWNVDKGSFAMAFHGHFGPVTCAVWTPDVKRLVSGSGDGSLLVYGPRTGQVEISITKDLSPDHAGVTTLCFIGPDNCVAGCEDGTLHVASLASGRIVSHLPELHEQSIESMSVNASQTMLLTASCDCKLIVWNIDDLSHRETFTVGESIIPAQWLGESFLILAGCSDGTLRVWDSRAVEEKPLLELQGHRRMLLSIASVTSSSTVATTSDDGTVRFFTLPASVYTPQ